MPYSIPAPTPAPLPIHSQGRPGHRRSFSEIAYNGFSMTNSVNGTTMSSNSVAPPMRREPSSGAFEPLRALPTRRKQPSFHLEADDDDDSSPEDEEGTNGGGISNNTPSPSAAAAKLPPPATPHQRRLSPNSSSATLTLGGVRPTLPGRPSTPQLRDDDDDEFSRPGLPPLKLKIPNGSLNLPFAGSPTRSASPALPNVGFNKGNAPSPPRTRSGSMENLSSASVPSVQLKGPSPLSAPPNKVAFPSTGSGTNTPTRSESPRPQFPRTTSSPAFSPGIQRTLSNSSITSTNDGLIILSNGRPLKSSLKSSASSPNIPFPSQSLVPSRIYAEIAAAQAREREEQARAGTPTQEMQDLRFSGYPTDIPITNRHARAASAPALPSLLNNDDSTPGSPIDNMPQTPSAAKAVHFPESDDITTVKFFRRSARPASVSLPGASGDEGTETETDGEGYGSSTGTGGWGNSNSNNGTYKGYNANTSWGWGGYVSPWDRFNAGNPSGRQQAPQPKGPGGYPFPRIAPPIRATPGKVPGTVQGVKQEMKVQKRRLYGLDKEKTSVMPKRELGLFENVFLEGVDLSSTSPLVDASSSSNVEGDEKKTQVTLTGSLIVRNLAYEKHVSVRFTLDEWHTTSEVKASYKESLERLPERWVGVMRGDPSLADDTTRPQTLAPSSKPAINPQWDRFTFTIDLSDYARSRSLVSRTMWMVIRFATPGVVRVPIAVPLRSSAFTTSASTADGKPGSHLPQADVLGPSDGNMLSTIISGVAGAPHHSTAAQERYMKGRETVEELLRKRSICVGVGVGSEWWDNNAGSNFKVGFTEREEIVGNLDPAPTPAEQGSEQKENEDDKGVQGRKRMNAVSYPPLFSTAPPPMSILGTSLSHSSLSPPQISVSTSLDSSSNAAPSTTPAKGTASTSAPATPYGGGPTTNNGTPNPWPTRTAAASKALAETTLERLKRLNLRNYAAPSAPVKPAPLIVPVPQPKPAVQDNLAVPKGDPKADGPPSRTSSTSSTSSWASSNSSSSGSEVTPMTSPLVTPTIGGILDEMTWLHEGVGGTDNKSKVVVEEKEDILDDAEPVGRVTPRPSAITIPTQPSNSNDVLSPLPISPLPGQELPGSPKAGSSPETSLKSMTSPIAMFGTFMNGNGLHGGEIAGGDSGMSAAVMGTSPPFSTLLGAGGPAQSGFGWAQRLGSAEKVEDQQVDGDATPMPVVTSGPLPSKLLENIREKSTSVPAGLGGRRPGSPMGSGRSSPVRTPSPTSAKAAAPATSDATQAKTGSGSDSGSSATARSVSGSGGSGSSGSHKKRPHHPRHHNHGLGLEFRSPTSPAASPATSSFASSFGAPRRSSPPGTLSPLAGLGGVPPAPVTSPMSPGGPVSVAGRNSLDEIRDPDSIYQAFVKQWCFASGPAPAQAGGFGTMNGTGDKKALE